MSMRSARILPRLATAGPSIAISAGEDIGFPRRLRLPRGRASDALARRLGAAAVATLFIAYLAATAVPTTSATSSPASKTPTAATKSPHGLLDNLPVSFE